MSDVVWVVEDNNDGKPVALGLFSSEQAAQDAVTRYIQKEVKTWLDAQWDDQAELITAWKKVKSGSLKSKLDFYNNDWLGAEHGLPVKRVTVKD